MKKWVQEFLDCIFPSRVIKRRDRIKKEQRNKLLERQAEDIIKNFPDDVQYPIKK